MAKQNRAERLPHLDTLQKQTIQIMIFAIVLSSITTLIYAYINITALIGIIPHIFNIVFYTFLGYLVTYKKAINTQVISIIAISVYAFIMFPPIWYIFGYAHPMIMGVSLFIIILPILLFEGRTKMILMVLIIVMSLIFGIYDIFDARMSNSDGSSSIGMYVGVAITVGMLVYCVNGFKQRYVQISKLLEESSVTDALTGAYNSRMLTAELQRNTARYTRTGEVYSVAMIDMDNFKLVNDSFGHTVGDTLLKEVVDVMNKQLRVEDKLARYGGDEFVVILPGLRAQDAKLVVERLLNAVNALKGNYALEEVSFSAGIADIEEADKLGADVLVIADKKLYHSKHSGRSQVIA